MRFRFFLAIFLLLAALTLTACDDSNGSAGMAPPLPAVTVANPLQKEVIDWDNYIGQFKALQRVEIRPRVSGYLVEVACEDGARVEAGDLLFRIDARPFEAVLTAARSQLSGAEARFANANTQLERARNLLKTNAVSQDQFDQFNAAKLIAQADVEAAQAAVKSAQLDLDFTRIHAPTAGQVSYRRVDVGNVVSADDTLLTTLVSVDPIHFEFESSEALFLKYMRGDREKLLGAPVRIQLQDDEGYSVIGRLDFIDNAINTTAGTIRARAVVDNPDGFLTPGMFGRLQLQPDEPYQGLLLPDTAIATRGAQRIVFVVDAEGVVSSRQITLGQLDDGLRVIRSGIQATDRVVINGIQRAFPGSTVAVTEATIQ